MTLGGQSGAPGGGAMSPDGGAAGAAQVGQRLVGSGHRAGGHFGATGIYDTRLSSTCSFVLTSESGAAPQTYHCIPRVFELAFRDSGCTQPVMLIWGGSVQQGDTVWARLPRNHECLAPWAEARKLGAPLPKQQFYRMSGTCVAVQSDIYTGYESVAGDAAELSALGVPLASATSELAALGDDSGLSLLTLVGQDGSRFAHQLELADGTECRATPVDAEQVRLRCLPPTSTHESSGAGWFLDSACQQKAFGFGSTLCGDSWGFIGENIDGCYVPVSVAKVGPVAEMGYFGDQCVPMTKTLYAVGTQIPALSYPVLERRHIGTDRLKLLHFASDKGEILLPSGSIGSWAQPEWWDDELKVRCYPTTLGSETRCIGATGMGQEFFSDSQCTAPIWTAHLPDCQGLDEPALRVEAGVNSAPDQYFRVTRHEGAVYTLDAGTCVAATIPEHFVGFQSGAEYSAANFPLMEAVYQQPGG
jgi:hypothetical protein